MPIPNSYTVPDDDFSLSPPEKLMPVSHTISKFHPPYQTNPFLNNLIRDPTSDEHVTGSIRMPRWKESEHTFKHRKFLLFECTCSLQFSTAAAARRHILAVNDLEYPCQFCDNAFQRKDALRVHESYCHSRDRPEPAIRDKNLVSEDLHSVTHLKGEEPVVGADIREHPIEVLESVSQAYEVDQLISGATGTPLPWRSGTVINATRLFSHTPDPVLDPHPTSWTQIPDIIPGPSSATTRPSPKIALLKVKDIDGTYIDIPLYEPLPWQKLCDLLVGKQVLAKQHLSSGDCVIYTSDGQVLFDQEWDSWIALTISSGNDSTLPQLQVELRIVRKSCCEKLSERDHDVCNGCSTPLIDINVPFLNPPDAIEPVPFPSMPHIETINVIPEELHSIATSVEITYTSENILVHRRKRQPRSGEAQQSSLLQHTESEGQNVDSGRNTLQRVVHVSSALYLYLIKPPFIALPCTLNDSFQRENLDFHLSFLQTWILGIDICLLGGAWAVSDLTTASQSPILQTFVQLTASFAFFGIIFGLLLSYTIGIMERDLFVQWFNQNRGNWGSESRVSVWNPIIMLNLPLTWTAWAILNTVVFILLYAWIIDPSGGPSIAKNIPGAFTSFVIGWSVFYVHMIQREVSRCKLYLREEVV